MYQMRETLRYYHYARSTEKTYCQWILRYVYFYDKKRHPKDMGSRDVLQAPLDQSIAPIRSKRKRHY